MHSLFNTIPLRKCAPMLTWYLDSRFELLNSDRLNYQVIQTFFNSTKPSSPTITCYWQEDWGSSSPSTYFMIGYFRELELVVLAGGFLSKALLPKISFQSSHCFITLESEIPSDFLLCPKQSFSYLCRSKETLFLSSFLKGPSLDFGYPRSF